MGKLLRRTVDLMSFGLVFGFIFLSSSMAKDMFKPPVDEESKIQRVPKHYKKVKFDAGGIKWIPGQSKLLGGSGNSLEIFDMATGKKERIAVYKDRKAQWEPLPSPDGKEIIYEDEGEIQIYEIRSRKVTTISTEELPRNPQWSPDSKYFVFHKDRSVWAYSRKEGVRKIVDGFIIPICVDKGRKLLLQKSLVSGVWVINADGSGLQIVLESQGKAQGIIGFPNDKKLCVIENQVLSLFDFETKKRTIIGRFATENDHHLKPGTYVAISPDGSKIAYTYWGGDISYADDNVPDTGSITERIIVYNVKTGKKTDIRGDDKGFIMVRSWSPDSKKLLCEKFSRSNHFRPTGSPRRVSREPVIPIIIGME